jgi:hypothetical protein
MNRHTCPVCGFDNLPYPPENHNICPCCGTQFGYDDATKSHEELRLLWLESGANWWSETQAPPLGWDPIVQLLAAKILPFKLVANETDERTDITSSFLGWGWHSQPIARVA